MWTPVTSGRSRGTTAAAGPSPASADSTAPMPIVWSPPSTSRSSRQPTQASVPSITGRPSWTVCGTPANLASSGALEANRRASSSWPAPSTLTPKRRVPRTTCSVRAPLSKPTSSSSGSSESDATALAVMPTGPAAPVAVITVTPVAKLPITERKWPGSTVLIAPSGCRTCPAPRGCRGCRRACSRRARTSPRPSPEAPGSSVLTAATSSLAAQHAEGVPDRAAIDRPEGDPPGLGADPLRARSRSRRASRSRARRAHARAASSAQPAAGRAAAAASATARMSGVRLEHEAGGLFRMLCAAHAPAAPLRLAKLAALG